MKYKIVISEGCIANAITFNDKDWSSGETIMPFFAFIDIKTKKILEFKFDNTGLSSFELSL